MLDHVDKRLAAGLHQMLKVTKAFVTVILGGYRRVGKERWECGKWSEDHQARFADTVWFRLQRLATSIAEIGHVRTMGEAKYTLWAPIEG